MAEATVKTVIAFLKKEFSRQGLKLDGIALFGSHLNGKASEGSDIDLILISEMFKNKNIFQRSEIVMDTELKAIRKFKVPLDLLTLTSAEFTKAVANKRYNAKLV